MEQVVNVVRSYHYDLSVDLAANQMITDCNLLWVHHDSAVTAKGELLVFGTYDLEITVAESYRKTVHHYVRYRTEAFRERVRIPELAGKDAAGASADVRVAGRADEKGDGRLAVALEVQAAVRIPVDRKTVRSEDEAGSRKPVGEVVPDSKETAGLRWYAYLADELEHLRAYVRRQTGGSVDVLSLNGVMVVSDVDRESGGG